MGRGGSASGGRLETVLDVIVGESEGGSWIAWVAPRNMPEQAIAIAPQSQATAVYAATALVGWTMRDRGILQQAWVPMMARIKRAIRDRDPIGFEVRG